MMDTIWNILNGPSLQTDTDGVRVLLSLLLAFVLGQLMAWIYSFTHHGLSYSKSFVQSLIVITVVVALVMTTIAGSFVVAVGLMGALSIIRFRNIIRDTRDIAFLFCSLVIGMACGSGRYAIAIMGTGLLGLILVYLYFSDFGIQQSKNAFLRFSFRGPLPPDHPLLKVLDRFCRSVTLTSSHASNLDRSSFDYAYQITIRNTEQNQQMLSELQKIEGIQNINLTLQDQILEL